jgi:DNA-binding response OmpR family regulator
MAGSSYKEGVDYMRVLVVDDMRIIADTLAQILRNNGFDTFVAYNGETAIATAIEVTPDLLITDVFMKDVNGVEAAIHIRMLNPDCRVILCTGRPDLANLLHGDCMEEYSFELLHKPISPHHLLARIRGLSGVPCASEFPHVD